VCACAGSERPTQRWTPRLTEQLYNRWENILDDVAELENRISKLEDGTCFAPARLPARPPARLPARSRESIPE
jgi:hypothetical protein